MASKSEKQKALQRSRQEAIANGTLNEWNAKRDAERAANERTAATPPDFGIKTLEAVSWPDGERYPRWLLPLNSDRHVSRG